MSSRETYLVPVSPSYAQPQTIPSSIFHPHKSSRGTYPVRDCLFALTFTKSWSIFASYMMSTSILITFMFTVPGRSLLQDVPLFFTTLQPLRVTRLLLPPTEGSLDEGRGSQACTSLPSRTVFCLSQYLVYFGL